MPIKGIRTIEKTNYSIFYVDSFSVDLKKLIRKQLQGIYNGFAIIDSVPEFYSYKNTLKSFLDRYNDKTDKIKKGMIGELLAHILLNQQKNNLTSLSILKNKEERSIKKGFDIIYCHIGKNQLWYSEVKAGRNTKAKSTLYNEALLNRAKKGISTMIDEKRNSLWESALIDVELVIKEKNSKLNLSKLLAKDSPIVKSIQKKNVILISSLFHNLSDEIIEKSVSDFHTKTVAEGLFLEVIIVSIQKSAYKTVAKFLQDEIKKP